MKQPRSKWPLPMVMSLSVVICGCAREAPVSKTVTATTASTPVASASSDEAARINKMAARFAPTEIAADVSRLSASDRQVLAKLVQASKIMDALFMRQVWGGNEAMLLDLLRDETPEGRARLHYFLINKGPWSRLDHNEPFVA